MPPHATIVDITPDNIADHPGAICFINPKHPQYHLKVEWFAEQFAGGLRIKLLYLDGVKKPVGFIEHVPGEHCWRGLDAAGWMVVHCLWTNGKKHQHQGLGGMLLGAVETEAKAHGMHGVAALTSDRAFMANRSLFLKNGYQIIDESGSEQLVAKPFAGGQLPSFFENGDTASRHRDLTLLWSRQCPWVARFMEEVKPVLAEYGLEPDIIELTSARDAQQAPTPYGVFSLVHDGTVYADRYVSTTRFKNILKKDMNLQPR